MDISRFGDLSSSDKNSQAKKLFKTDTLSGDQKTFVDQFLGDVFKSKDGDNPIANSLKIAAANQNTHIDFVKFDKKEQYGKTHLKLGDGDTIAKKARIEMSLDNNFKTLNKAGLANVNADPKLKAKAYSELADTLGNELASALSPQHVDSKEHEAVTFKFGHWFSLLSKRMANETDKDKPITTKDLEKETKNLLPDGVHKAVNTYDAYKGKTNNATDNTATRLRQLGLFKSLTPEQDKTDELVEHINKASDISNPDKPQGQLAKWRPQDASNGG